MEELSGFVKAFISGKVDLVGLDIGSYAVKAAAVSVAGKSVKIKGWGYEAYNFKPNSSIEEKKAQMNAALRKMLSNARISNKSVCIGVSGNSVIVRYVKLPWMSRPELEMRLRAEAEPFIPFDINDVNLGFHKIADIKEDGAKKMEVILVAAKREIISAKMDVITAVGLNPLIIDVDVFALDSLCNLLGGKSGGHGHSDPSAEKHASAVMVLNIGHKITSLAIIENGVTRVARDIFIAGSTFNKAIAKNLGIEVDRADELKKEFGLDMGSVEAVTEKTAAAQPSELAAGLLPSVTEFGMVGAAAPAAIQPQSASQHAAISNIIHEVLKDLVVEVRRSVDFFYSQGSDRTISRVYLCGGSANLKNIEQFFAAELNTPVEILNPFGISSEAPEMAPSEEIKPAMAVAMGLSLREMWDWQRQ